MAGVVHGFGFECGQGKFSLECKGVEQGSGEGSVLALFAIQHFGTKERDHARRQQAKYPTKKPSPARPEPAQNLRQPSKVPC